MLACQRHLFSIPENIHYLNCASRAPLLKSAEAVGIAGVRLQNAPASQAGEDYFAASETLRERAGALINASPDRIAVIPAVSYGVALATQAFQPHPAQNIVMPAHEFPSNVYAWWSQGREDAPGIRWVERPAGEGGATTTWSERVLEAIDGDTGVVHLSTTHWTDGHRFDVEAIGARARDVGALFIVDGTQSIGAEPFDFERIRPDLLVCAGYKWLMGPYQVGFAAVGDRLIDARPFEHHWSNRSGSDNPGATEYHEGFRKGARRFDVGEHANPITVPMLSEGVRQVLEWGPENIRAYCGSLLESLLPALEDTPFQAVPPTERVSHIVGIRLPDAEKLDPVIAALAERNIRVSRRGDALRVSPHVYNTGEDLTVLCDVLKAIF